MVFDIKWFQLHQQKLLWLCNHPVLKYWFRWVLRIHNDLKWEDEISVLEPNNYKIRLGVFLKDGKLHERVRADFRTHNKFSKRLYLAFKPIWWTMHFLDWICLDEMDYSFGFDTLVVYPDTGTGGDSVDGLLSRGGQDATIANISDGAGTAASTTAGATGLLTALQASSTTNQFATMWRPVTTFLTSSIGGGTVDSATLSMYHTSLATGLGSNFIVYVSGITLANGNALVAADYQELVRTVFANISATSLTLDEYNVFTLNASGEANIDAGGISNFALTTDWDLNKNFTGGWGSGLFSSAYFSGSDTAGTAQDPKLTVEYTSILTITLTETVSVSDSIEKLAGRAFAETVSVSDSFLKETGKIFGETITVADTAELARLMFKEFSDSIVVSDACEKTSLFSTILSETIALSDVLETGPLRRTMSENITVTDSFDGVVSRVFSESIVITDGFEIGLFVEFSESITVTDAVAKEAGKILSEAVTIADAISLLTSKTFTENITIKDDLKNIKDGISVGMWTRANVPQPAWTRQDLP